MLITKRDRDVANYGLLLTCRYRTLHSSLNQNVLQAGILSAMQTPGRR